MSTFLPKKKKKKKKVHHTFNAEPVLQTKTPSLIRDRHNRHLLGGTWRVDDIQAETDTLFLQFVIIDHFPGQCQTLQIQPWLDVSQR